VRYQWGVCFGDRVFGRRAGAHGRPAARHRAQRPRHSQAEDFIADPTGGAVGTLHRVEGVPYTVLPSSGKDPYGTPDRGGFTGWVDWSVDASRNANQQWLESDVRAFAQSITLNTPASLDRPQ
jgi:hypothetical protein